MSLVRVSELRAAEEPPPWLPSQVQVTVVQARGLRAKGGPGDAFVVLQLGRQKHRTSVATQRDGCPRWAEQCALELPPAPGDDQDPQALLLQLVVWQRALVGMDRFLGRAAVPLDVLLQEGRSHLDRWYKLHSKPGKKEKERGEIQLTIQFTRHSLTASMFDLSVKDKPRSRFGRLKDKMKGKQKYNLESASAIVSSSSRTLDEDFDLGDRKSRRKGFFFKDRLRRSSLTHSNTSLGSESTVSSASSPVGLQSSDAMGSPSYSSSLSTGRDVLPSPTLSHKRAFSDEVSQISLWPESQSVQSPKVPEDPVSRSLLCINGSRIYCEEPSPKPSCLPLAPPRSTQSVVNKLDRGSVAGLPAADLDLPPWPSSTYQKGPPKDPPRFIPSPPILAAQEEDKLSVKTIALNKQRVRAKMEEGMHGQIAVPVVLPSEVRRISLQAEIGAFHQERSRGREESSAEPSSTWAAVGGQKERVGSNSQILLQDSKEPAPNPSSQPGLPAATEFAKDPCVSEDQSLPPSVRGGELQAEPVTHTAGHSELLPAGAAAPAPAPAPLSSEGEDNFHAFATSWFQPGAPREPPKPCPAEGTPATDYLEDGDLPQRAASLPLQQEGESWATSKVAWEGQESPRSGSPDFLQLVSGAPCGPGEAVFSRGMFGKEERVASEVHCLKGGQALGEAASAQSVEQPESSEKVAWIAPAVKEEAFIGTVDSRLGSQALVSAGVSERGDWRALPGNQLVAVGVGLPQWALEKKEAALGLEASGQELQIATETAPVPEDPARTISYIAAKETRMSVETEGLGGAGEPRAEPLPPKTPRRVAPLHREDEAGGAGWDAQQRWGQGAAAPCDEEGSPGVEAHQQVPLVGAAWLIGAGVGGAPGATEGLGDKALEDNELARRAAASGQRLLVANGGAEQLATCPPQLSLGGLGLSGPQETPWQLGPGEPSSFLGRLESASLPKCPALGSLETSEGFLSLPGASPGALEPQPELSPSLLFWTALEEEQALPQGTPGLLQGEGSAGRGPPLYPGGGQLGQEGSPAQEPELSSAWFEGAAVDFKQAAFWQVGSSKGDPMLTPGNPFAPSLQSNPFVERLPEALWAPAAVLQVSSAEATVAPQGPPLPPRSSAEPSVAPSPHGLCPLAFSTPFLQSTTSPCHLGLPSPFLQLAPSVAESLARAPPFHAVSQPSMDSSAPSVLPVEMPPVEETSLQQMASLCPVKPIRSTPGPESAYEEKPSQAASLSALRNAGKELFTLSPASSVSSAASAVQLDKMECKQALVAKYHHLTHEELVQLLLRREAELHQKEEQVRELENYIDRLLVRIMEQSPTLLQIPLGEDVKGAQ